MLRGIILQRTVVLDSIYREMGYFLSFVYFLSRRHANAVCLPLGDVIFVQLAFPPNGIIFVYIVSN